VSGPLRAAAVVITTAAERGTPDEIANVELFLASDESSS